MLVGAVLRLTVGGGDPVVQLQTNFGGGKTHSMLALYHMFSAIVPTEPISIARSSPSFRRSAGNPSTSNASRRRIRYTRKSSTGCTPIGRRW